MELMVNGVGFLFIFSALLITTSSGKFWRKPCKETPINFFLFTRKNLNEPQKLLPDKNVILKSNYNPNHPNKIIIHGYYSKTNTSDLLRMKNEYLNISDYNILMIDWSEVATGWYPKVVRNLNFFGKCAAQLVKKILEISVVPKESAFHLIGHSLGAHFAAYVGNHMRPYKFARITGLDPALWLFTTKRNDRKLDETDAEFVDILHTNALIMGKMEPSGHVDFYINGGKNQPGCSSINLIEMYICSHSRAVVYFTESIKTSKGFYGWFSKIFSDHRTAKCAPVGPEILMGEEVDKRIVGSFFVTTAGKEPFAMGKGHSTKKLDTNFTSEDNVSLNELAAAYELKTVNNSFNTVDASLAPFEEDSTLLDTP